LFGRGRFAAASLAAATATVAAAGLMVAGPAQQALATTITQTGQFGVGNLLNYANSDIESTGFNWAPDSSQGNDIASIGQDTVSLMHGHSLEIVASGTGTMIYKLGNGNSSVTISLPKTGGAYRVGAYMKVPAGTSRHDVEFDLGCYDINGMWLGWVAGAQVPMKTAGNWQYAEDDFRPGTSNALPPTCAQVQGSPRVQVTGMNVNGTVHMDEAIFAPYRAALAIGAHGPKACNDASCPYTADDWLSADQSIGAQTLGGPGLQTDKEFSDNGDLPATFSDTNCAADEAKLGGLSAASAWPVCIITYTNAVTKQMAMDNFLHGTQPGQGVPPQQEIILVWHQEPEGHNFLMPKPPGCDSATTDAMAFTCETELQASFVHNSRYDTPNVFIAQDSAGSQYATGKAGDGCTWITPSSATGAGVDLYLVDHYENGTVTGQNVNQIPAADEWQNWLKCASAQNRPLGFGEYGLDNSPDPKGPQQAQGGPCQPTSQNRQNLPTALDADRTYLAHLPVSGDSSLVNSAPFVVWDYWDSYYGGTPVCTVLDNSAAITEWQSIESQNESG
jgi:hypothetical protein